MASQNPFAGFDTYSNVAQQQRQAQQQLGQQQQPVATSPRAQHQQPPPGNPFGQPQPQQMSPTNASQQHQQGVNPFAAFPLQQNGGGMVPQQPHQPGAAAQQQPLQQGYNHQALVPMAPQNQASPWAIQPQQQQQQQQQPMINSQLVPQQMSPQKQQPAAQSYDPLGVFGAPPQQPPQQQYQQQQQQYQQQHYQQPAAASPFQVPNQQPYNNYSLPPAAPAQTPQQKLSQEAAAFGLGGPSGETEASPDDSDEEGLNLIDVELDDSDDDAGGDGRGHSEHKKDGEYLGAKAVGKVDGPGLSSNGNGGSGRGAPAWDRNPDIAPPPPVPAGRRNSEYLSQQNATLAGGKMSSPLPNPNLVVHAGYVLSRISFRTVLMRKWKQTFWVQYGPTQLLFFRSYADYQDWLNNPYHTLKAREFLIKLRVDFVSDLKKSSVMGYQVTQIRRKPYGKNVMLHFKLERWMDYGPTIAAAFAARQDEMVHSPRHNQPSREMNTTNDVASLRKIILGCMRNARDAALIATREQSDMGAPISQQGEYRGRYDDEFHNRGSNAAGSPTRQSSGTMGLAHQAYSAESSERRRSANPGGGYRGSSIDTESSADDEQGLASPVAVPEAPLIDLLG